MCDGVTPALRYKLRNKRLSPVELGRFAARALWRAAFRKRYADKGMTAPPLSSILSSSWGWTPPVHDGVDLICPTEAAIYALCDGEIVRADAGGWWGKGAPSDPTLRGKGDGIIVLRSTVDVGPFRRGLNFAYGHAEAPTVRAGQTVKAGTQIGRAGFANAWHVHFMVNGRPDDRGVGDRDPMPFVDYATGRR